MTDQPQPLDLDAIEALAAAATPGPWFNDSHEIYAGPHTDIPAMNEWIGETCDPSRPDHGAANAALAAWSRDGVPALVAGIRRLTAELAEEEHVSQERGRYLAEVDEALTAAGEDEGGGYMAYARRVTQLAADRDRLTAELQRAQPELCADCGHLKSAHYDATGDDDVSGCNASGAKVRGCNCWYFIPAAVSGA